MGIHINAKFSKTFGDDHQYFLHMFRVVPEILWTMDNLLMIYINFSKKFADYIDQYFIGIWSAPALVGIDVLVY